ncbi:MAG TPA: cytochrome c, partial [Longimicrobiaceae bacterium]|nr:cytochrome c [Longimicrobiaceae bacterium]
GSAEVREAAGTFAKPRRRRRAPALPHFRTLALSLLLLGLSGCTDWALYDLDVFWGKIPFLSTLRESVAFDPQELPRLPAEGSIPVATPIGDVPPPFTQLELDSVASTLTNPLQPTAAVLARGEVVFERNCAVCHGSGGEGDGSIVGPGRFPTPPDLTAATSAARSPGYIYGVIRVGRGLMPAYGSRITHLDRWAVVTYLRQLQGSAGAVSTGAVAATETP